jgi:hypothetical protein
MSRTCCSLKGRSVEQKPQAVSLASVEVMGVIAVSRLDGHGRKAAIDNDILASDE